MNALMCDPKVLNTPQSMARRLIWFVAACSAALTTTQAHAIYQAPTTLCQRVFFFLVAG